MKRIAGDVVEGPWAVSERDADARERLHIGDEVRGAIATAAVRGLRRHGA